MDMELITKPVDKLADEIRVESNKVYPLFRNLHEAYGVIKEEKEEAEIEFEKAIETFELFWKLTKEDDFEGATTIATCCSGYLSYCIAELIQMKAMCDKVVESQGEIERFMEKPPEKNITVFEKIKQFFIKRKGEKNEK